MDTVEHPGSNTETAGVIARPPLLFLAALVLGFIAGHLLPLPFPISRIGLAHWISAIIACSMIFIGLALATAGHPQLRPSGNAGALKPAGARAGDDRLKAVPMPADVEGARRCHRE
jgi:hypothetical protein